MTLIGLLGASRLSAWPEWRACDPMGEDNEPGEGWVSEGGRPGSGRSGREQSVRGWWSEIGFETWCHLRRIRL